MLSGRTSEGREGERERERQRYNLSDVRAKRRGRSLAGRPRGIAEKRGEGERKITKRHGVCERKKKRRKRQEKARACFLFLGGRERERELTFFFQQRKKSEECEHFLEQRREIKKHLP